MLDKGEIKALKEQLAAVGRLLERLDSARRDAKYKRLLLEMVYFRRSHSLYGAAAYKGNTRAYRSPLECQNTACSSRGAGIF